MSQTTRYPNITDFTLAVILSATPGAEITRELVEQTRMHRTIADHATYEVVIDDLTRAHLVDVDNTLTPLADNYARMWRDHFAKQGKK